MPHIIVEHSSDIPSESILEIYSAIKKIMPEIAGANFDPEQCKFRAQAFDQYFVGNLNQKHSSFLHITIKILGGRSLKARQELAQQVLAFAKQFFDRLTFSPTVVDEIIKVAHQVEDVVTGISHPEFPIENYNLAGKRCDISVDIVEMDKETYQKLSVEN